MPSVTTLLVAMSIPSAITKFLDGKVTGLYEGRIFQNINNY